MKRIVIAVMLVAGWSSLAQAGEHSGTIAVLAIEANSDPSKPPMAQIDLATSVSPNVTCVNAKGETKEGLRNWTIRLDTYMGMAMYSLLKDARMSGKSVLLRGSTCLEWDDRISPVYVKVVD